jgi:hypothetical protein
MHLSISSAETVKMGRQHLVRQFLDNLCVVVVEWEGRGDWTFGHGTHGRILSFSEYQRRGVNMPADRDLEGAEGRCSALNQLNQP